MLSPPACLGSKSYCSLGLCLHSWHLRSQLLPQGLCEGAQAYPDPGQSCRSTDLSKVPPDPDICLPVESDSVLSGFKLPDFGILPEVQCKASDLHVTELCGGPKARSGQPTCLSASYDINLHGNLIITIMLQAWNSTRHLNSTKIPECCYHFWNRYYFTWPQKSSKWVLSWPYQQFWVIPAFVSSCLTAHWVYLHEWPFDGSCGIQ